LTVDNNPAILLSTVEALIVLCTGNARLIGGGAGATPQTLSSTAQEIRLANRTELLQGTLEFLILRTLRLGDLHGWGISKRVRMLSDDVLQINQGSLYPALYRLEERGFIDSHWGISPEGRKAKFYKLTDSGREQLAEERASWRAFVGAVEAVLKGT
jgi:PadR family transcriptional regulator, regulatory protein PadR